MKCRSVTEKLRIASITKHCMSWLWRVTGQTPNWRAREAELAGYSAVDAVLMR